MADGIASSALPVSFTVPTADLAVTDTGPTSVAAGGNATYTITLTNNGPSAATDALLTDLLPAGSTLVSFAQTSGSDSFTINQSATNVAAEANSSIAAGSSDTFVLTVSAPINFYNGEVFSNSATVSTNAIDPVSANNTAAVTGSIVNTNQSSAFVVTNSGPSTGTEAGQATYTLTVTNNGPTDAPNVILTDVFGAHALEVSTTQSQGPGYSLTIPNEVLFLFGTIPAGQTATATVTVELAGYGGLTNSASAYSSSDPNTTTNTAVVTTIVPEAPIVVSSPIKVTVTSKSLSVSKEVVATFTHANGVEPASNFVATINWGDNSTSTGTVTKSGTTYSVTGSHTLLEERHLHRHDDGHRSGRRSSGRSHTKRRGDGGHRQCDDPCHVNVIQRRHVERGDRQLSHFGEHCGFGWNAFRQFAGILVGQSGRRRRPTRCRSRHLGCRIGILGWFEVGRFPT